MKMQAATSQSVPLIVWMASGDLAFHQRPRKLALLCCSLRKGKIALQQVEHTPWPSSSSAAARASSAISARWPALSGRGVPRLRGMVLRSSGAPARKTLVRISAGASVPVEMLQLMAAGTSRRSVKHRSGPSAGGSAFACGASGRSGPGSAASARGASQAPWMRPAEDGRRVTVRVGAPSPKSAALSLMAVRAGGFPPAQSAFSLMAFGAGRRRPAQRAARAQLRRAS
mmetsp:Transcript_21444/g.66890  ORF Transcript_21444/g.66890 Transcript_21444/m.66890 type:complete len:228 (+) Transcript_21444:14-697(+)